MIFCMTEGIEIVSNRVIKLRKRLYGSQQTLVKAWHARFGDAPHQTHISGIERGDKGLSLERLGQLAELLETNADYLLGLSDDDKPASDLEDQVVFSVRSDKERKMLDTIGREFLKMNTGDQAFVLEIVKRMSASSKPRIIGDE